MSFRASVAGPSMVTSNPSPGAAVATCSLSESVATAAPMINAITMTVEVMASRRCAQVTDRCDIFLPSARSTSEPRHCDARVTSPLLRRYAGWRGFEFDMRFTVCRRPTKSARR